MAEEGDPLARALPVRGHEAAGMRCVLRLGEALHRLGASTAVVEEAMLASSRRLGLRGQFFTTPTSLFAAFGPPGEQVQAMLRVEPGEVSLARRAELETVLDDLVQGHASAEEGEARIERLLAAPPLHGPLARAAAFTVAGAAAAVSFGGGLPELAVAALAGLAVASLEQLARTRARLARVLPLLAAVLVAALAVGADRLLTPIATTTVTLGGLIVLLPGLSLTLAISELAEGHLVAGTARLFGGITTLLMLGFGVALGSALARFLPAAQEAAPERALPLAAVALSVLALAPCYTVLFEARWRELGWIAFACVLSFGAARSGALLACPVGGAGIGAFAVALAANVFGLDPRRAPVVIAVPGLVLLVPGSLGLRGLSALIASDVVSGVEGAFQALLVALALVTGGLLANLLVPQDVARPAHEPRAPS